MRTTHRILYTAILVGLCGLTGCPPKEPVPDPNAVVDPAVVFQDAVLVLQTPDNKSGEIDHGAAYNAFVRAAELGAGPRASFNAGWTAEMLGQTDDAERHYRKAYEGDKGHKPSMYSLVRLLQQQGKSAEAVDILREQVASSPEDRELRNDLVAALSDATMFDEAIAEAQELLRQDPKDASVYRNLSSLYYAKGEYGMSQLCNEKAMELHEGDPGTYNNMGVTYLLQGDEPAAIEKFKTALKLDEDNFESNMNLGFTALNSGDYALALDCFTKASAVRPNNVDAKLGLAVALRGNKDYDRSGTLYDEIIKADPENELAYFNASTLHEKYTKDYGKSLKYLQTWADLNTGKIGPDDKVFVQMDRVKESKAAEEEADRLRKQKEAEEKARIERQKAVLEGLKSQVAGAKGKISANEGCLDPMLVEEIGMFLEQGDMIIASEDYGMAPDIQSMLDDYYGPMLDEAVAACASAPPAPEPEGTDEAPAPEGDVAPEGEAAPEPAPAEEPAEGAPAEGAPAEGTPE